MGMFRLQLLFAACIVSTIKGSIFDNLYDDSPRVRVRRKDALLPCTYEDGVLDCSGRGKFSLSAEDLAHGSVTILNLYDNELGAFPDGFLQATVVNMSNNQLHTLPLQSQLNPQILKLDLSKNKIANASDGLRSLGSLETLIVSKNYELGSLQLLPQPCGLRHLEASNINLHDIRGHLSQCTLLQTLDLSSNSLSALPEDTFSSLTHLQELDLGRNSIGSLSSRLFNSLTQLRRLELNFNGLRALPADVFNSLSNLERLNLQGNLFQSLPSGIFSSLTRLKHLNLFKITLETFPTEVANLPALEELYLGYNGLTSLPENSFLSLPRLKEVLLMYNNISSLPNNIFSGKSNLKYVTLGENPLTTLPSGLFADATNLHFVWLPCIGLNAESLHIVGNATNIIYGSCGRIEIKAGVLSAVSQAETLLFVRNSISLVREDAFIGLPQLQTLDLSENDITELPAGVFSPLSRIQRIFLMRNRLTTIPAGLFSGNLNNLKAIVLAQNRLTEVPENVFHGLQALESVDLSDNLLTTVPPNLFADLPALKEVNFDDTLLSTLPPFGPAWASIRELSFGYIKNLTVDAASLRPWLAGGERHLVLESVDSSGLEPAPLGWLLQEPGVTVSAGNSRGCHCGVARRGGVLLHLCLRMRCASRPRRPEDWLQAALQQAQGAAGGSQVA